MAGTSTSGYLPREDSGQSIQKPYFFSTIDDSGTSSPIVLSSTAQKLVAPIKAAQVLIKAKNPLWVKTTATSTSSGFYMAANDYLRIPVYPRSEFYLYRATAVETTATTLWDVLS